MFQTRQRHHRQSRSEDSIRSHPMPHIVIIITTATMTIAPGYHHQQSHSVSGTTASSKPFCSLKRRFPWWAATTILTPITGTPPQFRSLHNLSPVLSASGSSKPSIRQPSFFFSPGMGYFRRASSGSRSGTVDCGELWGCRERLRLLGG